MAATKTGLLAGGLKYAYEILHVGAGATFTWDSTLSSIIGGPVIMTIGTVTESLQAHMTTWSNTTDATTVTVNLGTSAAVSVSIFAFGT